MAAPNIEWKEVTGAGATESSLGANPIDFGSVQAGYWSDAKCVVGYFTINSANTLKFWLYDTTADANNPNVGSGANWTHKWGIDTTSNRYVDPANITDAQKAGTSPYLTSPDVYFATLVETEPVSANVSDVTLNNNTDYIFLAVKPPADANDGVTEGWGYRLSFLYP